MSPVWGSPLSVVLEGTTGPLTPSWENGKLSSNFEKPCCFLLNLFQWSYILHQVSPHILSLEDLSSAPQITWWEKKESPQAVFWPLHICSRCHMHTHTLKSPLRQVPVFIPTLSRDVIRSIYLKFSLKFCNVFSDCIKTKIIYLPCSLSPAPTSE